MNALLDGDRDEANIAFPLPYRIFFLIGLGILGWATNLHGLEALDVDAVPALDLRTEDNHPTRLPLSQREYTLGARVSATSIIRSTYLVFLGYTALCVASWTIFRLGTKGDASLVDAYGHVPVLTAILLLLIVWCPYDILFKTERDKFVQAIRRCLLSSMNTPIHFSDVIFADIGTSYAKVLGDVWLSLSMLFPGNTLLNAPSPDGLARYVLPAVMSVPYFIRFRQCIIEYNLSSNESRKPFYNAIKYATAFPVIFLSAAQRIVVVDLMGQKGEGAAREGPWHGEHHLFRLWLLAVFVNSAYSFWWDISNDWGFDLLRPESTAAPARHPPKRLLLPHLHSGSPLILRRSSDSESASEPDYGHNRRPSEVHRPTRKSHPYGLRSILFYPLPVYPLLILANLVLRMTWSVKLTSHLHSARDGSMAVFWLELAEIVRRWLWTFIRVEWEVVKRLQAAPQQVKAEHDGLLSDSDTALSFDVLTPTVPTQPLPDA